MTYVINTIQYVLLFFPSIRTLFMLILFFCETAHNFFLACISVFLILYHEVKKNRIAPLSGDPLHSFFPSPLYPSVPSPSPLFPFIHIPFPSFTLPSSHSRHFTTLSLSLSLSFRLTCIHCRCVFFRGCCESALWSDPRSQGIPFTWGHFIGNTRSVVIALKSVTGKTENACKGRGVEKRF